MKSRGAVQQLDAAFNPQAAAIGIRGTAEVVGIAGTEGIFDRVRREWRAVAAIGVTRRVRIIRVRTELAAVVPLLIVQSRRIRGERILGRLITEGTAVGTEGIVQAVRLEGASSPEGIGRGVRIERISTQLAEIFRVDGEWEQRVELGGGLACTESSTLEFMAIPQSVDSWEQTI
jgi:hypothetical protein